MDVKAAVDWYMEGKINIDDLITHVMPIDQINDAFELIAQRRVYPHRFNILTAQRFVVVLQRQGSQLLCLAPAQRRGRYPGSWGFVPVAAPLVPTAKPPSSACSCPEGHGWRRAAAIGMLQTPAWERVTAIANNLQPCYSPLANYVYISQHYFRTCLFRRPSQFSQPSFGDL